MTAPASGASSAASSADAEAVRRLIGREPHPGFRVAVRCPFGTPAVIENAPHDERGYPFPTREWLTCRALAAAVSRLEADGGVRMLELETGGANASPEAWEATVLRPALEDVRTWLWAADGDGAESDAVPHAPEASRVRAWRQFECVPCKKLINGELAWAEHQASARHQRNCRNAGATRE